jgi:hypothetical protein
MEPTQLSDRVRTKACDERRKNEASCDGTTNPVPEDRFNQGREIRQWPRIPISALLASPESLGAQVTTGPVTDIKRPDEQ